jgi:Tol biopolymer transport system component
MVPLIRSNLVAFIVGASTFPALVAPSEVSRADAVVGPEHGQTLFLPTSAHARRSPTGRIAFSAGVHPHEDIYVVNADGSGLKRLTSDRWADFDPSWSPDGRRIAYRHESAGGDASAEIYVMDADGSLKRNLTRRAGPDYSPAWSRDGKRIAFASFHGSALPSIWVMKTDGSEKRRVSPLSGEYPTWSPDGRKIAFDRNTFGPRAWDIWVVGADGSRPRPLIASHADEQGAAWSPDGKTIAYASSRGAPAGYKRIWLARADGSRQRLLTKVDGERPAWTKPGTHVLFTAGGMFLVRRDGSGLRSIPVRAPGEVSLADWTS